MQDSCSTLKDLFKEALSHGREDSASADLKDILTKTALEIIRLRLAAKHQIEEGEAQRTKTAESKAEVDLSSLQLQNLLYEKNYYNKEIASCKSFASKYTEEEIGLLDIDSFKREAPDHFLSGIEDAHELQLQRLAFEKFQRQELVQVLQEVRKRKEAKEALLAEKQRYLDDIQAHLDAIREAAGPLSKHLLLPPRDATHQQQFQAAAAHLPLPLYIIYRQLKAISEIYADPVEVSITGNEKEAIASAQAAGAEVFGGAPKQEAAPATKRSKKSDRKSQSAEADNLAHPLSLMVSISTFDARVLLLHFLYIPQLEVVTVKAADPTQQPILGSLFPEDTGASLPTETALQLSDAEGIQFPASRLDRPYMWAQHLAGLDFLPPLTASGNLEDQADRPAIAEGLKQYRRQHRVQTVLRLLRSSKQPQPAERSLSLRAEKLPRKAPKRVRSWEETVKQNAAESDAAKVSGEGLKSEGIAEGQTIEEDGALPEEGELPDT